MNSMQLLRLAPRNGNNFRVLNNRNNDFLRLIKLVMAFFASALSPPKLLSNATNMKTPVIQFVFTLPTVTHYLINQSLFS